MASHQTAARIWGAIVPDDGRTHISCVGRRPQVARLVAHRLIIEYDGRQHAEAKQWDIDVDRREWMDGTSWRLVVRSKDIYRTPALTLSRILGAMRDKGMDVPRPSEEWRQHFPSLPEDVAEPA